MQGRDERAPGLVTPRLVDGSALLPLPWNASLGSQPTRQQARDADKGLDAQLTYLRLRSDGGPGELSLQRLRSPQPAGPLTAVVAALDEGRLAPRRSRAVLPVPALPAPPGGQMVLVPRPAPAPPPNPEGARRAAFGQPLRPSPGGRGHRDLVPPGPRRRKLWERDRNWCNASSEWPGRSKSQRVRGCDSGASA